MKILKYLESFGKFTIRFISFLWKLWKINPKYKRDSICLTVAFLLIAFLKIFFNQPLFNTFILFNSGILLARFNEEVFKFMG